MEGRRQDGLTKITDYSVKTVGVLGRVLTE